MEKDKKKSEYITRSVKFEKGLYDEMKKMSEQLGYKFHFFIGKVLEKGMRKNANK